MVREGCQWERDEKDAEIDDSGRQRERERGKDGRKDIERGREKRRMI